MDSITFLNPNDILRKHVKKIYADAKKYAAINNLRPFDVLAQSFANLKITNEALYKRLLEVMYIDYSIYLMSLENVNKVDDDFFDEDEEYEEEYAEELEDDEEELAGEELLSLINDRDDLLEFAENHSSSLFDMAQSIDVREIDLAHLYSSMNKLDKERLQSLLNVFPSFMYDYMEFEYPFVLQKLHSNLKNNPFCKDVSSKSESIIDMIDTMKEYSKKEYRSMILYYLEIYYKHKKFGIEYLDSVVTKNERTLIKQLEEGNLDEVLSLLETNSDLLETVINVYSEFYFSDNKIRRDVERYYSYEEPKQKLNLIFRKGTNNEQSS